MSSTVTAAVIAAAVSLVVAVITGVITFITTQRSQRRAMTARLYDERITRYPGLFKALDAFRRSRMDAATDLEAHLQQGITAVDAWHADGGGLVLSERAYDRLKALRNDIRRYCDLPETSDERTRIRYEIWQRKGALREAMRADLGLLYEEDVARRLRTRFRNFVPRRGLPT